MHLGYQYTSSQNGYIDMQPVSLKRETKWSIPSIDVSLQCNAT